MPAVSPRDAGTVVVAEPDTPDTLDPYRSHDPTSADVTAAIFDSLLTITPHGSPRPGLALRWARSSDSMHWTFWLNPAAHWQDGEPVSARDVLFTARLVNTPAFDAVSTLGFDHIRSISAIGTDRVVIDLSSPYAPFLATFGTAPILPAHVLGAFSPAQIAGYTAFNRRPIGSGPYIVTEFVPGDHVTLVANAAYFKGAPELASIEFNSVPDPNMALAQLRNGQIDLIPPTEGLAPVDVKGLQRGGDVRHIRTQATPGFSWLHIDLIESGYLREGLVRQALAEATPKQQIVDQVYEGLATVAGADQPPSTRWYEPAVGNMDRFDLAAASHAFEKLGFKRTGSGPLERDRVPLMVNVWAPAEQYGATQTLDLIATAWQHIGVVVKRHIVPAATLFSPNGPLLSPDRLTSTALNAVLYTWTNAPDPDDSMYWHSIAVADVGSPMVTNFVGYKSAAADRLITMGQTAIDLQQRTLIYRQLQLVLARDQPAIFVAWPDVLSAASSHLQGYQTNAFMPAATWNVAAWRMATSG